MSEKRHSKVISHLAKIAQDVPGISRARLAAAVVVKNEIISIGVNSKKTDPFQKRFGKNSFSIHLHAEISAIKNALKRIRHDDLAKSTLYVARVKSVRNSTVYGLSKPCAGCQRAIAEFGIKKVIYTNEEETQFSLL